MTTCNTKGRPFRKLSSTQRRETWLLAVMQPSYRGAYQRDFSVITCKLSTSYLFFPSCHIVTINWLGWWYKVKVQNEQHTSSFSLIAMDTVTCKHRSFLCAFARSNKTAREHTLIKIKIKTNEWVKLQWSINKQLECKTTLDFALMSVITVH